MSNETAILFIAAVGYAVCIYTLYFSFIAWRWGIEQPTLVSISRPMVGVAWMIAFPMFRAADPGFPLDLAFLSTALFVTTLSVMGNSLLDRIQEKEGIEVRYGVVLYNAVLGRWV